MVRPKTIFLISILFTRFLADAQDLQWSWARGGGGNANDSGQVLTIDVKRNFIYVAGNYNSSSIVIGSTTLANNGAIDFFVAKYDTAGTMIWAKRFGGVNADLANGIECDTASGSIYLCGTYDVSTQLGSINLNAQGKNFFVLKLDQDGIPQWAKSGTNSGVSGSTNDFGNDLTVLSTGDIVMVGQFYGGTGDTLIIDNFKLLFAPVGNPAGGQGDRLLLKLNSSGTVLNAVLGGGIGLRSETFMYNPNRLFLLEKDNQDNLYVGFNKDGGSQNAGIDCGGLLSGASTQVGTYRRNFTVFQFNSNLVQTNRYCREVLPPNRPGCTIVSGYSTEMTDMARDVNGNIFVAFRYIIYEGPGPLFPTCESFGNGIKRIITPGNTGVSIEKFLTPVGKFAAFNNLLFFYDTGPAMGGQLPTGQSILYDFEQQAILSTVNTPIVAQDITVLNGVPKIFVTGSYNTSATIGSQSLPTLPQDNFVLLGQQIACVSPPTNPIITAGGPISFCAGGSVTLSAQPGYFYSWTNGATTQSIIVNTTGNYSVTVTNANGCSSSSVATIVNVNPLPPTPTITSSGATTFCQGSSVTLTAPPGFNYLWTSGSTSQSINVNASGNYSVTITNANGCSSPSAMTSVAVNPLPAIPTITVSGPTTFCQGGSVTLTAPAGFNYLWSTGATSQTVNINASGNYSVAVTDANGCSSTSSMTTITVNPLPVGPAITANGPTTFCQGGSVTLSAPAGFSYIWSTGATTQNINVTASGNYSVSVTNANGCSSSSALTTVTVNPLPAIPVTTAGSPTTFCQGGSVTLTAPAGFNYLWNTSAMTQSINATTTGSYSVSVTNANGCSSSSTPTTVIVNPLPPVPTITASGPTTFCQGGSVTLTAPAGFSYLWNTGATTQSINVNSTGNYAVTVTNASSCSSPSVATAVTVNSLPATPVITASGPTTFCQGGSVTLTAPAGYNYLWSNAAMTQAIIVSAAGNYSVTVTNANGCSSSSASTTVTVNALPAIPTISASGPTSFCQGGSVTLTAPAGFTYLWSPGATTQSINVNTSGSVNVRITNANGCSSTSANTTVTVNALPAVPTITQNGNILTSSPATTYQWYFNGVIIAGATSQSYTYTIGGDFTVVVTNAAGCSATSAVYTAMRRAILTIGNNERFSFNLFPNPVNTQLQITYQVEQTHSVGISLVNMNGRRIPIQNPVQRSPGSYSVNANAVAERIWTGVYILEFTVDNERVTRMIVKF